MKLTTLLEKHRDDILKLAQRYGARDVRVFGSVARGDDIEQSDVDVLVNMEPGRSLFDMGGLLMDLEQLLGCKVDLVTEKGLKPRIRDRVLREAVRL
jgi:predicted nucleotidyltransferase